MKVISQKKEKREETMTWGVDVNVFVVIITTPPSYIVGPLQKDVPFSEQKIKYYGAKFS